MSARKQLGLLTPRERQVLGLLMRGLTVKETGKALGLAQVTIRNHVFRMCAKLDVSTQHAAVAVGYRACWDDEDDLDAQIEWVVSP